MRSEKELRQTDAAEQLRHNRYIRRKQKAAIKKAESEKSSWLWEFSKKVVVMCVLLHAAVFLYSAVVMWRNCDIAALPTIISESSEMMRTCVFGYFVKAGIENWQKIRNGKHKGKTEEETEGKEGAG